MLESSGRIFDLSNKTAIVTGCSRGIGKAIAIGLARFGADIIGVSKSTIDSDADIVKQIEQTGQSFNHYQADFNQRDQIYHLVKEIKSKHPRIDILINNAGIIKRAPAATHSDLFWDEVIQTNLTSQFILSREIGNMMLDQKQGKIIFIASLLSFQGGITVPGYAASKGGIQSLIKALANEWASSGINVNGIAPGYVSTDNTEALRQDATRSEAILSRIPAGRWGQPDDLVGPAVFLASDASTYVNGTILTVDGGWMGR